MRCSSTKPSVRTCPTVHLLRLSSHRSGSRARLAVRFWGSPTVEVPHDLPSPTTGPDEWRGSARGTPAHAALLARRYHDRRDIARAFIYNIQRAIAGRKRYRPRLKGQRYTAHLVFRNGGLVPVGRAPARRWGAAQVLVKNDYELTVLLGNCRVAFADCCHEAPPGQDHVRRVVGRIVAIRETLYGTFYKNVHGSIADR